MKKMENLAQNEMAESLKKNKSPPLTNLTRKMDMKK